MIRIGREIEKGSFSYKNRRTKTIVGEQPVRKQIIESKTRKRYRKNKETKKEEKKTEKKCRQRKEPRS